MRRVWTSLVALVLAVGLTPDARGQIQLASRGPKFLSAKTVAGERMDASGAAVLRQRVAVALTGVTVEAALKEIARQADLELIFTRTVLPQGRTVTLHATDITVAGALTVALLDTGLDVLLLPGGQMGIVPRLDAAPQAAQLGAVVGRVADAKTAAAIAGATVVVEGTQRRATTGNDGRYRIAEVAPGSYTVRARYIGYAPGSASATVTAEQEATADFALEKSAQRLNEVVTTGTVVPTEVKALPTPVTVISDSDIALQRPHTIQEMLRQAVPTMVSWDPPALPTQTSISVRGASTLNTGLGQMKIFVDGIETANPTNSPIDPNSVERIEVIRGPQAAAIYGSDAIGGVIQVFTKRGDPRLRRPQVDAEAALGVVQTPYSGYGGVLRQTYTGAVRGGGKDMGYNFGAGYSHTGDYLPNGEISRQSSPSAYGGVHFSRGIVTADVSGRYYAHDTPLVLSPDLAETGFLYFSKPLYQPYQYQEQTLGARLSVAATPWSDNNLTAGIDRRSYDLGQPRARLTTPADTLLTVSNDNETRTWIGYNTSIHGSLGSSVTGSLTAGFDHYSLALTSWFTAGALAATGTITTDPSQPVAAFRSITNNTGYFAQAQVGISDALFLTGGLRAEQNSDFGDSLGTPLSPRLGVSFVQPVGPTTLKLRGSWGRAIRAPDPGLKSGSNDVALGGNLTLPNPRLGPERQHGWDAGVDAVFGGRGSISITYFNQTAENVLSYVLVEAVPVATYQWQNIARLKNTGVEIEGSATLGPLQVKGQYGYTRSRVEQLDPTYAGDLRVGDRPLATPKHTAGASLSMPLLIGTTVAAGLTYVGSWNYYDLVAEFRCFGGTGPCQPSSRDYIIAYPSLTKVNATISQQITTSLAGFVSVDNLTNNERHEFLNTTPVMGRITTAGLRFHF
jgi:outer membrane receptor protein involved in Fe transport